MKVLESSDAATVTPHLPGRGQGRGQQTVCRFGAAVCIGALELMAGVVGVHLPVAAADLSVSKPVGQLFAPGTATLLPAGERWLRSQVAGSATCPDHMVVVQIPGATPDLQQQRALVIRQRLGAFGVSQRHVYVEAAPTEPAARMAGL